MFSGYEPFCFDFSLFLLSSVVLKLEDANKMGVYSKCRELYNSKCFQKHFDII